MTQIKKLKNSQGVQVYPQTHTKAVIDDNGYTVESRMQAVQDVVNQAQMAIGAVPSDLTPTEDSTNWVTSGGVYNSIQVVQSELTELEGEVTNALTFLTVVENGLYFVDSNMNIGAFFDNDGFHAINMLEYEKIQ